MLIDGRDIDFVHARILVVGDVILDEYIHGAVERISPEAPVPVVHYNNTTYRLGGAANVAMNLKALGCNVHLLALVGEDHAAEHLQCLLKEAGISNTLQAVDKPTIRKVRITHGSNQLLRIDYEDTFSIDDCQLLLPEFNTLLAHVDSCILSDYAKGTLSDLQAFIQLTKHNNVPVFVDPKYHDIHAYKDATFITPNEKELSAFLQCDVRTDYSWLPLLQETMHMHAIKHIVHTQSTRGMSWIQEKGTIHSISAKASEVFDVTGAGDTVIAVLCAFVTKGFSVDRAMYYANKAAGVAVSKVGVAPVYLHEIIENSSYHQALITNEQVLDAIYAAKAQGDSIVMTNGCFDILHSGHVSYLKQARALGDRLVVAINDDVSVRQLKGEYRPINSLEERITMLRSLQFVDWVLVFSALTPLRIIQSVMPDYLVKGGDYAIEDIVGGDIVSAAGGIVKVLPFVPGKSTSNIVRSIQEKHNL